MGNCLASDKDTYSRVLALFLAHQVVTPHDDGHPRNRIQEHRPLLNWGLGCGELASSQLYC